MFELFICIFLIHNLHKSTACTATADVKTNVDILENLAKVVGFEKGAFQSWIADGALTGVENRGIVGVEEGGIKNLVEKEGVIGIQDGGVDVLDNMKEIVGIDHGGVVGVAADGVKVDTDITTGGITIGIIVVIFGIMFFFIVIYLLQNNRKEKDTENSSALQVIMI